MMKIRNIHFTLFLVFLLKILSINSEECVKRYFEYSSFVCVCNSTYCNFDGSTTPLLPNKARIVTSSRDEYRNFEQIIDIPPAGSLNISEVNVTIYLDSSHLYQSMLGFGGAFTDSASINIKLLSEDAQDNLMRLYFGEEGSRYNLVRVPIAGADFSVRPYSYDDVEGDVDLVYFNLTVEDYEYKLPLMRRAIELCPDDFYIFGSPWAPPAWMKSNGVVSGPGDLLKEYWQPYSNYLVKFIEAYEEQLQTQLWGLTPQNEPLGGYENWLGNGCGWTAEAMREWIADYLGPTLEAAGYRRLVFMVDDYNRYTLPWYNIPMLTDQNSSKYIDGIAVHWYDDTFIGPDVLDEMHEFASDKFILMTEACEGPGEIPHVQLGSWERGQHYLTDIIENNNHWSTGWVDWNLALDVDGGPNWANNFADAPIIVNAEFDEFYVEPMYYALSLFSRNVPRGSSKIYHTIYNDENDALRVNAFLNTENNKLVVIIGNTKEEDLEVGFADRETDIILKTTIGGMSWVAVTF